jgi:DNA-binding transcriptional LysR family regulator
VRVRDVVSDVQRLLETNASFDPATSDREFLVATTDYVEFRLLPTLSRLLGERAPHVRLRFVSESPGALSLSRDELRAIDVLIAPAGMLSEVPHVNLFRDRWVLIADEHNQLLSGQPDLEQIRHLSWVLTHHRRTGMVRSAPFLRTLGVDPVPSVMTDDFFAVPFLVANSNRIALLQERLARWLAPVAGCRIYEVPAAMPPHVEACWWHPLAEGDAGHAWFRRLLVEAGSKVDLPAFRPETAHLEGVVETG